MPAASVSRATIAVPSLAWRISRLRKGPVACRGAPRAEAWPAAARVQIAGRRQSCPKRPCGAQTRPAQQVSPFAQGCRSLRHTAGEPVRSDTPGSRDASADVPAGASPVPSAQPPASSAAASTAARRSGRRPAASASFKETAAGTSGRIGRSAGRRGRCSRSSCGRTTEGRPHRLRRRRHARRRASRAAWSDPMPGAPRSRARRAGAGQPGRFVSSGHLRGNGAPAARPICAIVPARP